VNFANVADNLRESFRVIAASRQAGEIRELPGTSIASAGVTFQMFNAAFLSSPVESEAELARRIATAAVHFQARGLQWAYWICEDWMDSRTRRRSRKILEQNGLRHSVDLPGMVAPALLPAAHALPELEIQRVGNNSTRNDFCGIGSVCFHVPIHWFHEVFDSDSVWDCFAGYVGYFEGEPVSTTAIVRGAGVIGVYNVATLPGFQRRGFGEAVMRYALSDTRSLFGPDTGIVLQSTPAGFSLYERMGFRTITRVSVYAS
jgi:GNAT superfamily N-acetyltransferase